MQKPQKLKHPTNYKACITKVDKTHIAFSTSPGLIFTSFNFPFDLKYFIRDFNNL